MIVVCPECSHPYDLPAGQISALVQVACPTCEYRVILDFEAANDPGLRAAGQATTAAFQSAAEYHLGVQGGVVPQPEPRPAKRSVPRPQPAATPRPAVPAADESPRPAATKPTPIEAAPPPEKPTRAPASPRLTPHAAPASNTEPSRRPMSSKPSPEPRPDAVSEPSPAATVPTLPSSAATTKSAPSVGSATWRPAGTSAESFKREASSALQDSTPTAKDTSEPASSPADLFAAPKPGVGRTASPSAMDAPSSAPLPPPMMASPTNREGPDSGPPKTIQFDVGALQADIEKRGAANLVASNDGARTDEPIDLAQPLLSDPPLAANVATQAREFVEEIAPQARPTTGAPHQSPPTGTGAKPLWSDEDVAATSAPPTPSPATESEESTPSSLFGRFLMIVMLLVVGGAIALCGFAYMETGSPDPRPLLQQLVPGVF